jgi:formate dehydrogenase subunit gamma
MLMIAHIYIGTVGMEGALDTMTTGKVDENWAREHHSAWLEEVRETEAKTRKETSGVAPGAPAE